jgi:hypothetical protein
LRQTEGNGRPFAAPLIGKSVSKQALEPHRARRVIVRWKFRKPMKRLLATSRHDPSRLPARSMRNLQPR